MIEVNCLLSPMFASEKKKEISLQKDRERKDHDKAEMVIMEESQKKKVR